MEYQVQMVYEREDVGALVRTLDFRRQPEKRLRQASKIGFQIFGVLLIIAGVSVIAGIVSMGLFTPAVIITVIISLACFLGGIALLRRSDTRGMERRSWAKYPNKGLTLTYTFLADHFEEEDEVSGKNQFQYLSIKSANEDAGHFFLFTQNNAAHMLRKDSFICGDPNTFAKFLQKKAAVTIDPVE